MIETSAKVETDREVESKLSNILIITFLASFDNIFPLLAKSGLAKNINFYWNTGTIAPGESVEYIYYVPVGYVDVADWLAWDLSQYYVADVEWVRDGVTIWSEFNTTSYKLEWKWFRAEAHSYCRMKVTNNGSSDIIAIWRGQCFFLDERIFKSIISMTIDSAEDILKMNIKRPIV